MPRKATKKYEITKENIEKGGVRLFRVKALKNFSDVKAGDVGGYIQNEENLSQDGKSWIYGKAAVYDHAKVIGNAVVKDKAQITDTAVIKDNAEISGTAWICKNTVIGGKLKIEGDAFVFKTPEPERKKKTGKGEK